MGFHRRKIVEGGIGNREFVPIAKMVKIRTTAQRIDGAYIRPDDGLANNQARARGSFVETGSGDCNVNAWHKGRCWRLSKIVAKIAVDSSENERRSSGADKILEGSSKYGYSKSATVL